MPPPQASQPVPKPDLTHAAHLGASTNEVEVRFYAGAAAAARCQQQTIVADTLGDLVAGLNLEYGTTLVAVLQVASFLVDGVARRDPGTPLPAGCTVDVLPPFAGG